MIQRRINKSHWKGTKGTPVDGMPNRNRSARPTEREEQEKHSTNKKEGPPSRVVYLEWALDPRRWSWCRAGGAGSRRRRPRPAPATGSATRVRVAPTTAVRAGSYWPATQSKREREKKNTVKSIQKCIQLGLTEKQAKSFRHGATERREPTYETMIGPK